MSSFRHICLYFKLTFSKNTQIISKHFKCSPSCLSPPFVVPYLELLNGLAYVKEIWKWKQISQHYFIAVVFLKIGARKRGKIWAKLRCPWKAITQLANLHLLVQLPLQEWGLASELHHCDHKVLCFLKISTKLYNYFCKASFRQLTVFLNSKMHKCSRISVSPLNQMSKNFKQRHILHLFSASLDSKTVAVDLVKSCNVILASVSPLDPSDYISSFIFPKMEKWHSRNKNLSFGWKTVSLTVTSNSQASCAVDKGSDTLLKEILHSLPLLINSLQLDLRS